jgi:plasmid stabilization system protein ParE
MRRSYTVRQRARQDVEAQRQWYLDQFAFDAAIEFVAAVEITAEWVVAMPGTGRTEPTRKTNLEGLPFNRS